uniref:Small ribosomal subunit protein uS14c n=1 Tax=Cyanoptyche gloeocystis TaxID=77922 RepID=A0A3G1IWA6_9EUKA|nr:ribosomal protein S14 [Cyanoptyche gloeocystis]|mmetsp:Transcript_16850/g.29184  ORF Transcript_16850/g.29184 Transcript_16850/m.29184 type:complete len:101 (+) Transcript_16850:27-329(+)
MAKKSMIEREKKRQKLVNKFFKKRNTIKEKILEASSLDEKIQLSEQLQNFPRNSSFTRLRKRCWLTGRSRGYYSYFGLSRHVLREMAHEALLPGVTKSSW